MHVMVSKKQENSRLTHKRRREVLTLYQEIKNNYLNSRYVMLIIQQQRQSVWNIRFSEIHHHFEYI